MSRFFFFLLLVAVGGVVTGLIAGSLIADVTEEGVYVRSIAIGTIYTALIAFACGLASHLMHRHVPLDTPSAVAYHVLAQAGAVALSFPAATALAMWLFSPPFTIQAETLGIIGLITLAATFLATGVGYTLRFYRRAQRAEQAALEAELSALRAQINPHFLFNALNTIAALTRSRPEVAEEVTENLAALFRYSLQASQKSVVTLDDELDSARLYLQIEKARFGERLEIRFEVPEHILDTAMPSLVLQPLVENAVKHGVSQVIGPCRVNVSAEKIGDGVRIRVTDTGPGFDAADVDDVFQRGTGLSNVRERLRLYDRNEADLELLPQGVLVTVPYRPHGSDGGRAERLASAQESEISPLRHASRPST